MQKIGAHISAARGVSNAPVNAHNEQCEVFQFFVSSPQTYKFAPPSAEQIALFRENCARFGFDEYYVHAPYLVNLCSPKNSIRYASISLLRKTLDAADALGVRGVMFHTGSATGCPNKADALRVGMESMKKILDGYSGKTKLLIENAAGSGNTVGVNFAEVSLLLKGVSKSARYKKQIGVCLDTQHAFGSGYDWRTKEGTAAAIKEFEKKIGLSHLVVMQANDSKVECGSNKDRHEHIGHGHIGIEGFQHLFAHPKLQRVSWILETEPDGRAADLAALKKIRDLK